MSYQYFKAYGQCIDLVKSYLRRCGFEPVTDKADMTEIKGQSVTAVYSLHEDPGDLHHRVAINTNLDSSSSHLRAILDGVESLCGNRNAAPEVRDREREFSNAGSLQEVFCN